MKNIWACFLVALAPVVLPEGVHSQVKEIGETNVRPTQETKRLFEALAGDWDTTEKRERTQFFPNGGERKGRTHVRLAAGGATLVTEGHSDGSAGPLSYLTVIWWDKDANLYRYFICFKDTESGCEVRGIAHWHGDKFVNDYEEVVNGKRMKFRDTFEEITPNSNTLAFAWVKDDGSTQPVITTKALRRPASADQQN
jgi:hypothetical protein